MHFSIRIHFGGELRDTGNRDYVGGSVDIVDGCNPEKWSLCKLDEVANKLGFEPYTVGYYYLIPGRNMADGLVYMLQEDDAAELAKLGSMYGLVDVFFIHRRTYNLPHFAVDEEGRRHDSNRNNEESVRVATPENVQEESVHVATPTPATDGGFQDSNMDGGTPSRTGKRMKQIAKKRTSPAKRLKMQQRRKDVGHQDVTAQSGVSGRSGSYQSASHAAEHESGGTTKSHAVDDKTPDAAEYETAEAVETDVGEHATDGATEIDGNENARHGRSRQGRRAPTKSRKT